MRYVVLDLETQNTFGEVGTNNPADLDISVGCVYDSETDAYTATTIDTLHELWPVIEKADVLVGYNSDHFDIPLLDKYYPGNLLEIKSIDLLASIKDSLGRRLRLDTVAEATVGAKKLGDGLMAIKWWREGNIEAIKKYCLQDVKVTKEIFEFALKNQKILFRDGRRKQEVPIDTSSWTAEDGAAMTHSLPF